jgi:hypothetical protein
MKDLVKTKFCLAYKLNVFQMKFLFINQHTKKKEKKKEKVLKHFYIEKAYPLGTPMVVQLLDVKKDHFWPSRR